MFSVFFFFLLRLFLNIRFVNHSNVFFFSDVHDFHDGCLTDLLEEMLAVVLSDVLGASSPSFSPVSGTFPVLLQLPNGQTMPVAIPASITSSSVHIPTTIPVSRALLLLHRVKV